MSRASWWSITINFPEATDRAALDQANWPSFVKMVKYQDEIGEKTGSYHIQGAVNTAQVRFSQMKSWLVRAHIEPARDKDALLKYVAKADTAVQGTQVAASKEYLTMEKGLKRLANYYEPATLEEQEKDGFDKIKVHTREYWAAVNRLLEEDTSLVQLYTNPQMLRSWVYTKNVWLKYKTNGSTTDGSSETERRFLQEASDSQEAAYYRGEALGANEEGSAEAD